MSRGFEALTVFEVEARNQRIAAKQAPQKADQPDRTSMNLATSVTNTPSKYRNTKTTIDGIVFDSKKEATRYAELKLLERAGEIQGLERQVPYPLLAFGQDECAVKVGEYVADFRYFIGLREVIEDVKSPITRKHPVYRLKKKIVEACSGLTITET